MNKTISRSVSLKDLFREVRALRMEVAMFLPTETIDGYKHPKRIMVAYKKAIEKYPAYAGR